MAQTNNEELNGVSTLTTSTQYMSQREAHPQTMASGMKNGEAMPRTICFDVESIQEEKEGKISRFFKVKETDSRPVRVLKKYLRFVGPGLMISVAYMDPGNFAADVQAGATSEFALLFIVLFSSIIAIFLQSLCIKLGSVTGLDLSRACRGYFPRWLNLTLWFFSESAIIATDVAEVIGTAIALNILLRIPLPAGVVLTVFDVLFVLMAYRPGSSLKFVRMFEYAVALLVFGVVVCFCIQLAMMPPVNVRNLFRGFAPSKAIFEGSTMYTACSILGATVMPHSLFLGSGLVQPRLREFDTENHYYSVPEGEDKEEAYYAYRPTEMAIKYAMKYSIAELSITLFTFAVFVNSAILIVSAASLYGTPEAADADLYAIHDLLSITIAPAVGTLFMLALLFSGQSAGIVCTIAGQIVAEGHLRWKIKPWKRRIVTRSISIIPCLVISLSIGKPGLNEALNASQVVLSILLPFLTAPLIYFTSKKSIMRVQVMDSISSVELESCHDSANTCNDDIIDVRTDYQNNVDDGTHVDSETRTESEDAENGKSFLDMSNNWITTAIAVIIWLLISTLNVYTIVKLAMSGGVP